MQGSISIVPVMHSGGPGFGFPSTHIKNLYIAVHIYNPSTGGCRQEDPSANGQAPASVRDPGQM